MCSNSHKNRKKGSLGPGHEEEHSIWNRRTFMQMLGLAGTGTMLLGGSNLTAATASPLSTALSNSESDKILVLIRLKGGNDGLNTIIPLYDYDTYAQKRPSIRIPENKLYTLSDQFAIASEYNAFQSLWGDGKMKVVHGVGYPEQNLSHFTSTDNWTTGNPEYNINSGVMGRYFDNIYPDYIAEPPTDPSAIQIGSVRNLIFEGDATNYSFSVSKPEELKKVAETGNLHDINNLPECVYGDQLGFLRSTANSTLSYAGVIHDAYENGKNNASYNNDPIAQQLSLVARIIKGGIGTKMYLVTLDGFDTHNAQSERHTSLMSQLSEGLKAFYDDLGTSGDDNRVLSMTFSEFGRRIQENGSNGTDHGAASAVMLFGPGLNGNGFGGEHPDLNDPDEVGNLKYSTDFRSIYSTVLKEWMCVDAALVDSILPSAPFATLDLGFSCEGENLGSDSTTFSNGFKHVATYTNRETFIEFNLEQSAHISIDLYTLSGQKISSLSKGLLWEGNHRVNVKERIGSRVASGQYIYILYKDGKQYSNNILLN